MEADKDLDRLARRAELLSDLIAEWLMMHPPEVRDEFMRSLVCAVEQLVARESHNCTR